MSWKWFGVKTVFRKEAIGKPTYVDASYEAKLTLVEERIVLIRARSFDEAISKAEAEAEKYAAGNYSNCYGQLVTQRYLRACDAFELYDDPNNGVEVYSNTELVPKRVSDSKVIDQHLGIEENKGKS